MFTRLMRRLGFGSAGALQPAPALPIASAEPPVFQGYVEEISAVHVQGWAWQPGSTRVVTCDVMLPNGETIGQARADQFRHGLAGAGINDGRHGFWLHFDRPLSAAEQEGLTVRVQGVPQPLPTSPALVRAFEPLLHVAMDIVDNCNLRCPFCLYDYSTTRTTHMMTGETLEAALRFLPYTRDGEFWFSCLHEPTLHPRLIEFIEQVPPIYRRKLFFTTNLAKRMPETYFAWLARNGMHHINVSIESLKPDIYEKMRKGARHPIFLENWERLMKALAAAERPTPIHYITMAYKSNLRELPELVRHLLEERRGSHVEVRYTYDVECIPGDFRAEEFLDEADWQWLTEALAPFDPGKVRLIRPPMPQGSSREPHVDPSPAPSADEPMLAGRYMFRLSWDGSLRVVATLTASSGGNAIETVIEETNIGHIGEPTKYFGDLMRRHEVC